MSSPVGYLRGAAYPIPLLRGTVFSFGRGRQNSVFLKDAMVSRLHAVVSCDDAGAIFVMDLDSSNKTFVNDEALEPKKKFKLKHNDEIRMGGTIFRLKLTGQDGSAGKTDIDLPIYVGEDKERTEVPGSGSYQQYKHGATEIIKPLRQGRGNDAIPEELREAIELAAQQQRKMLPNLPQIPGMQFAVLYQPFDKVSGDFYDFFEVGKDQLALVIGDVSGHGIGAALAMSMIKKCLKIHGRRLGSPMETLRVTNADIKEDLDRGTFCSIFYGVLNTVTRKLICARAGHSPLIVYNAKRDPMLNVIESKGFAAGIGSGTVFNRALEETELQLQAGDMLLQFTDGLLEAANKEGEQFGMERICRTVERFSGHEPEHLIEMLELLLNEHCGEVPLDDDLTIICIKVY